ncbi:hypothetical protein L209DRAFT_781530 [Thermothelomyces heterothallicus CBS 203.75]
MDPVSAANNITAFFSSVLQGLEFVHLARSFGDDLKAHQLRGVKWVLYKKEQKECDKMGDGLKTLLEAADAVDPLLQTAASQKLEADATARGVSVSAGVNNGVQLGVNYGSPKGLIFGDEEHRHQ